MKRARGGKAFWDKEYRDSGHFALSETHSEDLEKFTRWIIRESGKSLLNITASVLDIGCGNGRNILWLAETFGVRGTGYDISGQAIIQARRRAELERASVTFSVQSMADPIPVPDESQTFVLDMMASHFLKETERSVLRAEIFRVLKPGGYLLLKTFLLDEDSHARRLIRENPGGEANTYIHPEIGVAEHVSTEEELYQLYEPQFVVEKIHKSHRHTGRNGKRRSITLYIKKPEF